MIAGHAPRVGSLFTGSGQLDEAVRAVFGGELAWHAEVDPAATRLLAHRYPDVPNLGDLTAVDWTAVEPVEVATGGFPCQDVSHAGKRAGLRAGTRSGLWATMCDAIDQLRPALVVAENVRGLLSAEADSAVEPCPGCLGDGDDRVVLRALGRVLGDLADLGYDARWCGLRAADVGAPHGRFRVFILAADARSVGCERWPGVVGGRRDAAVRIETGDHPGNAGQRIAADADVAGLEGRGVRGRGRPGQRPAGQGGAEPAADASGDGRDEGRAEPTRLVRGSDAALSGAVAADAVCDGCDGHSQPDGRAFSERKEACGRDDADGRVLWGQYEPAIRRWEAILGRPAPAPTEPGPRGGQRLSPRLTEWMMGWPDGWVTDVPGISRNDALRICGNGVVPQQAAHALRLLLAAEAAAA